MKKNILAAAILAISCVSFSAFAQAPKADNNGGKAKVENKQKCPKGETCQAPDPFAGLNITEAQKTQLTELNKKNAELRKAEGQQRKEAKDKNRAEGRAKRQEAKRQYLNDVKAIVGPEQYVVFLENFYVNAPGKAQMSQGRPGKDAKGARPDGKKGDKNQGQKNDKGQGKGQKNGQGRPQTTPQQ